MARELRQLESLPVHDHGPVDLTDYRLRLDGLVETPLSLTQEDLAELPQVPFDEDFVCLEGWVAPDQHWRGVPLMDLLGRAGIRPDARWVQVSSGEFSLPLPIEDAQNALLALALEGAPLEPEHGAPVRLVLPGGICFTSVKWVDHIELRSEAAPNTAEAVARARLANESGA
jgi:DMSO/TMAO reductase YedYZ molybdopterin-dependent catalytic subunit